VWRDIFSEYRQKANA